MEISPTIRTVSIIQMKRMRDGRQSTTENSYHHQRFHFVNLEQFDIIPSTIYLSRNNHRSQTIFSYKWFEQQQQQKKMKYSFCINAFVLLTRTICSLARFLSTPRSIFLICELGIGPTHYYGENTSFIRIFVYLPWASISKAVPQLKCNGRGLE